MSEGIHMQSYAIIKYSKLLDCAGESSWPQSYCVNVSNKPD